MAVYFVPHSGGFEGKSIEGLLGVSVLPFFFFSSGGYIRFFNTAFAYFSTEQENTFFESLGPRAFCTFFDGPQMALGQC